MIGWYFGMKKILITDDSDFFARVIELTLAPLEFIILRAKTGAECLKMVADWRPDLVLLDIILPDMSGFEVCKILRSEDINNLIPIIILTSNDSQEDILLGLEYGADDYVAKPFNARELLSRVKNTLRRIDKNRNANPLTGLPGNLEIQNVIKYKIEHNLPFAVIYADLDNFKAYNDVYGFSSGDIAIKTTAEILRHNLLTNGNSNDFIGHIGGDDFIIVTTPDSATNMCRKIIDDFDQRISTIYNAADIESGFIFTTNRYGEKVKYPLMTISLAVITNENRGFCSYLQVAEIAAELKKKAKSMDGSNYIKDRRTA